MMCLLFILEAYTERIEEVNVQLQILIFYEGYQPIYEVAWTEQQGFTRRVSTRTNDQQTMKQSLEYDFMNSWSRGC
jgi:hypothetical protein